MRPSLVVLMDGQHHDIVGRQEKDGVNVAFTAHQLSAAGASG